MKTQHISVIIVSFMLVLSSSQIVFGSQQNTTYGYVHYGPSRQSIPSYLVSPQSNPTLEEQFGSFSTTELAHDGSILILNQTSQKLVYKMGENISISTELINIGNKDVDIAYVEPWVALEIKNQIGTEVWPNSQPASIPEFGGKKTLQPGEHISVHPWGLTTTPNTFPIPRLSIPGNYTVVSVALFTFNTNTENAYSVEPLWSKPLQITILPEKVPEFSFVIPVLLIGIISLIIFHRIRIRK